MDNDGYLLGNEGLALLLESARTQEANEVQSLDDFLFGRILGEVAYTNYKVVNHNVNNEKQSNTPLTLNELDSKLTKVADRLLRSRLLRELEEREEEYESNYNGLHGLSSVAR